MCPFMRAARYTSRGVALLAVPVAALALAACGGGSSQPSGHASSPKSSASSTPPTVPVASSHPTSCSVVTQAEASAALGQHVRAPVIGKATVESGKACVFYGPDVPVGTNPDVAVGDSVRVVLVVGPDAKKFFNNYRHKVHAKTIAGLGDKAFYDGYASISVLKGDAYVRIAVGIANNLGPEEMLARDALPRM
jgi:hypothetical protein